MFGIGGFEFLLIIVFALLVFGPDKMPEIGRTIGRGIKMFNDARADVENVVRTEILRPEDMDTIRQIGGAGIPGASRPAGSHSVSPVRDAIAAQEREAAAAAEAAKLAAAEAEAAQLAAAEPEAATTPISAD